MILIILCREGSATDNLRANCTEVIWTNRVEARRRRLLFGKWRSAFNRKAVYPVSFQWMVVRDRGRLHAGYSMNSINELTKECVDLFWLRIFRRRQTET